MIADPFPPGASMQISPPVALSGENVFTNVHWSRIEPCISILVPSYKDNPSPLIDRLNACERVKNVELIIYDDGSADRAMTAAVKQRLNSFKGAGALITASANKGRAFGRNRLETIARSSWILYLDADMLPDDQSFLRRYIERISANPSPVLYVGGFSLDQVTPTTKTRLHWQQCLTSECVPAKTRQLDPGRFVFTCNVLVHKDIMIVVPFDKDFKGWGWEDVDWGIRASKRFPVKHLDNTATHLGLDTTANLLKKYQASGRNFWLLSNRHKTEMEKTQLYIWSKRLSMVPGKPFFRNLMKLITILPGWIAPISLRLLSLKLFRAFIYAEAGNDLK